MKNRLTYAAVGKGELAVRNGALVLIDKNGVRTQLPVGGVACVLLEPGLTVTHAAVALAAQVGTLLVWVGDDGVRLYSAGQPGGARSDKLLFQASLALDPAARLRVVRKMYALRFGRAPKTRSIEQLRGLEGARVRKLYAQLAEEAGVEWEGRRYDPKDWRSADLPNRCLSAATSCLYSITEAAVLAAGYAPAVGFLHTGKPRSFVYDIADLVKFDTVVPTAFRIAARNPRRASAEVREACREMFQSSGLLRTMIPLIEEVLTAGGQKIPGPAPEALGPAFDEEQSGDDGHRG